MATDQYLRKKPSVFRFFLSRLRPFLPAFIIIFGLASFSILFQNYQKVYIADIIDFISTQSEFNLSDRLIDKFYTLFWLFVLPIASWFICLSVWSKYRIKLVTSTREYLFEQALGKPISFFDRYHSGLLGHKVNQVSEATGHLLRQSAWDMFETSFNAIIAGTFIFLTHAGFGIFYILMAIIYVCLSVFLTQRVGRFGELEAHQKSTVGGRVIDVLSHLPIVRVFQSAPHEKELLQRTQDRLNRLGFYKLQNANHIMFIQGVLNTLIMVGTLFIAAIMVATDRLSIADFVLIYTLLLSSLSYIWSLGFHLPGLYQTIGDIRDGLKFFGQTEGDQAIGDAIDHTNIQVIVDSVSFSYPNGEDVFNDFSLTVDAGEKIGLIGPSGAGKTTLIKLLLGFYPPNNGQIKLQASDGTIISNTLDLISYIPQNPSLFERSIRDNIAYGQPDADMDKIIDACKKANAHDFISGMKNGYATQVGERGVRLSGGQRQRIAISRAILQDKPILILDEATSSLDSKSEQKIQAALDKIIEDKTVIAIAHRLSTLNKMDRIIVMRDGKIIEDDTPENLLNDKTSYFYKIWQRQSGGFIPNGVD